MKYSTGRKRKLLLQGHRKRRKSALSSPEESNRKLSWTEYKTIRQYQTFGDLLELIMLYGHEVVLDEVDAELEKRETTSNGYLWLTKDPPGARQ